MNADVKTISEIIVIPWMHWDNFLLPWHMFHGNISTRRTNQQKRFAQELFSRSLINRFVEREVPVNDR